MADDDIKKLVNYPGLETYTRYLNGKLAGKADASDLASYEKSADLAGHVDEILAGKDYATKDDLDAKQNKLTETGSASNPVYIDENGNPQAGNYIPSLNGSQQTSEASFYAPTEAGTEGQVLMSNGSGKAPDWGDITDAIPLATESQSGLMSAEDKGRLDSLYTAMVNPSSSLENSSWTSIAVTAAEGKAQDYWKIGDTKTITLSTGEEITVRIIGFDHDASNSITFEMVDLFSTTYAHHTSNTNAGGWDESDIRSTLNDTIFSQLPNDLQGVVRTVTKKASAGSQSDTITDSQDKLFLLSMAEVFSGSAISSSAWSTISNYADVYNAEGSQYEYYKDLLGDFDPDDSTSLLQKQRNGSNYSWWLRSPSRGTSTGFWCFSAGFQYVGGDYASYSYGVAFCFCV